jgi:hypothetical protein
MNPAAGIAFLRWFNSNPSAMPSSVIEKYEYDAEKRILLVTFLSGKVYAYKNVPKQVYVKMREYTSKGRYLNLFVKGFYDFEEISAPDAQS